MEIKGMGLMMLLILLWKLFQKGHSAFPWISAQPLLEAPLNKCPKRGLMTTGGHIPIEKHYRSLNGA